MYIYILVVLCTIVRATCPFLGKIRGDRLLVVGSGPSVYELAYLVPHYSNIVLSDVADRNLAEIRKWVQCDPCCYNFSPFFKHFATRAGIR